MQSLYICKTEVTLTLPFEFWLRNVKIVEQKRIWTHQLHNIAALNREKVWVENFVFGWASNDPECGTHLHRCLEAKQLIPQLSVD